MRFQAHCKVPAMMRRWRSTVCLALMMIARTSASPILASLQPPSGPSMGGTSLTVRGSGFVVGSTMCRFGPAQSVAAVVASSTQVCINKLCHFLTLSLLEKFHRTIGCSGFLHICEKPL